MLVWTVVLIAAIILELVTITSLVSIWFVLGALASMICVLFNFNIYIQIIVFFIVSLLSLILIRPLATSYLRKNIIATNSDKLIDKKIKLLKDVDNENWGEAKINGVIWNVASVNGNLIKKDELVKIVAIEGSKLIVKEI